MEINTYISIPAKYSNGVLTIKALEFEAEGETPEEALFFGIQNTALYSSLSLARFNYTQHHGEDYLLLEVHFSPDLYNKLIDIEPFPDTLIKKRNKSFLVEPTSSETLKYGYTDMGHNNA
jgi:hypothetical protein